MASVYCSHVQCELAYCEALIFYNTDMLRGDRGQTRWFEQLLCRSTGGARGISNIQLIFVYESLKMLV